MATYGDLKTRVADELLKKNLSVQIAAHIGRAIEFYAGKRWWFNTGTMTGATTAGSEYQALPTGTRLIDKIMVGQFALCKRSAGEVAEWQILSPVTGQPYDYAEAGDSVRLYPIPNATYPFVVVGTFDQPALSTDLDSNAWTNEGADLIAARTRLTMFRDVLRDPDGVSLARDAIREAEADLEMKTIRRVGQGRVRSYL